MKRFFMRNISLLSGLSGAVIAIFICSLLYYGNTYFSEIYVALVAFCIAFFSITGILIGRAFEKLKRTAMLDDLTQLWNKRYFNIRLSEEWAGLLAEAAEDALEQVDVVARGAAGAVRALFRIDGDRKRRAHRLAQLAGDAALLTVRVATQRVQATETRRLRGLFHRVHQRVLGTEQVLERQPQAAEQFQQQQALEVGNDLAHGLTAPPGRCRNRPAARTP